MADTQTKTSEDQISIMYLYSCWSLPQISMESVFVLERQVHGKSNQTQTMPDNNQDKQQERAQ